MKVSHGYFSMRIGGGEQNLLRTTPRLVHDTDATHQLVLTHPEGPLLDELPEGLDVVAPAREALFSRLYELYKSSGVIHLYTINENPIHRLPAYASNTPIIDNPRNLIAVPHSNRVTRVSCASRAIANVQDCPGKVEVIPNGVELDESAPPCYEKFSAGESLRLIEVDRADKKRTHRAEDFMPELRKSFPDAKCHVVGRDGQDKDGIKYHGHLQDPTEIYERAHFLVHFVGKEPFGMTPLEGYRAGVIPVVAGEGGVEELVEHAQTGYFMENPDERAVVKQLEMIAEKFYENPEYWVPMAKNGFELAAEKFSLKKHVDRYSSLYESVAGTSPPRSFPELDWSPEFNQFFQQLTLGSYEVNPQESAYESFPHPLERDLGRLIQADSLVEQYPQSVVERLVEIETEFFENHYEVNLLLARAYRATGESERARRAADRARSCEPDLPEPYFLLAELHVNNREVGPALATLKKFKQRQPEYKPVNEMLSKIETLR